MMRRRGLAGLIFLLCMKPVASSAAPPLEVIWNGPAGCSRASEVESTARRVLVASQNVDPGRFVVELSGRPDGYRLEFSGRVGEDSSRRILDVSSCDEAEEAAVLLVVLALDPAGASRLAEDTPALREAEAEDTEGFGVSRAGAAAGGAEESAVGAPGESGDQSGSAAGDIVPPRAGRSESSGESGKRRASKRRVRGSGLFAGVGFVLQSGLVSTGMGPGMEALVGARWGGFHASVAGSWFPPQTGRFGSVDDLELSLSGWSGRVTAAHLWTLGALRWGPQLDFRVQSVVARREMVSGGLSESIDYVALGGNGLIEVPLSPWFALAGSVGVQVPLHRPGFIVEPLGVVFQPGELSFCAALDVIFSLPLKKSAAGGQ